MKALKIILIVFFAVISLGITCLFLFLQNLDISKYKTQIIAQLSTSLNRQVDFDQIHLKVSLKDGLKFRLSQFRIQEDPAIAAEDFLQVEELALGVDILSFVTKREVLVTEVLVKKPRVRIVRLKTGTFNLETLGPAREDKSPEAGGAAASTPSVPAAVSLPAIFIKDVVLENGAVTYVDQSGALPAVSEIADVQFNVFDFSLTKPFRFSLKARMLSAQSNLAVEGTLVLDLLKQAVKLKDTVLKTDLALLSLAQVKPFLPATAVSFVPEVLEGQLDMTLKEADFSAKGEMSLAADVGLKKGRIGLKEVALGVSLDVSQLDLQMQQVSLDKSFPVKLSLAYLSDKPNFIFDGQMAFDVQKSSVTVEQGTLSSDLGLINLPRLKSALPVLAQAPFPETLGGKLQVGLKGLVVSPQGLENIGLNLDLADGKVNFKELAPGIGFAAEQMSLKVENFTLGEFSKFKFQMAYFSDLPNVLIDGAFKTDPQTQQVELRDSDVTLDVGLISLEQMKAALPGLKEVPWPEALKGKVRINLDELQVSPRGLGSLTADVEVSEASVKMKELAVPIEPINVRVAAKEETADIENFLIGLGEGRIKIDGLVKDYSKAQNFQMEAVLENLDLKKILAQEAFPYKIEGLIAGSLKAQGAGLTPEAIKSSLTGLTEIEVKNGRLKDLNLLKVVLDKIAFVPDMAAQVEASLPAQYKEKLSQNDTVLKNLTLKGDIKEGAMSIIPLDVDADGFLFRGQGRVGLDLSYSVAGDFAIAADLSSSMAVGVEELKNLVNDQGEIFVPLHFSGIWPQVEFGVDVSAIGKNYIKNRGRAELEKVLGDVFGKSQEAAPASQSENAPAAEAAPQPEEKSPEEEIIGNILDKIFK